MPNKNLIDEEQNFYQELDQQKAHQSCCTCQTFLIFFVILLVILGGLIYFIYWQISRDKIFPSVKISSKVSETFNKKITNLNSSTSGNVELLVTNEELNSLIGNKLSHDNFSLDNIQVSIMPENLIVYGKLTKPFSSKVSILLVPTAQKGEINFAIKKIIFGSFSVPGFLTNFVSQNFTKALSEKLTPVYQNIYVENIHLKEGKALIFGKKRS